MSEIEPPAVDPDEHSGLREQLAQTQARYRALVEQIPAVLYVDLIDGNDSSPVYVSPQVRDLLGIEPNDWTSTIRDIWGEHIHPDDAEEALADWDQFVETGVGKINEYRMIRPDGNIIWIHDRAVIVHDQQGRPVFIQGVMFDVTVEREAQETIAAQVEQLKKVDVIGREFTDQVLQGVDLNKILEALAGIVGDAVVLEDAAHQVVGYAAGPGDSDAAEELLSSWDVHSREGHQEHARVVVQHEEGTPPCWWIPIVLRNRFWGRMHVLAPNAPLDEIDQLALDRAAAAVALTLHSEQHIAHLSDHDRGALMSDIWEGRFTSAQEVLTRARQLGAELEGRTLIAMVVEPASALGASIGQSAAQKGTPGQAEDARRRARSAIVREVRTAIRTNGLTGLSAPVGDRVLAIVGLPEDSPMAAVRAGELLCETMATLIPDLVVVVGLSGPADTDSLRLALTQADEAAAYGSRDARRSAVHSFHELGIHHLLLRLADGPELAHFVESQLEPVLAHDARSSSPLLPTLRAFLANGARKAETARTLHLQRRSLYYRLNRIRDLLGKDLDDAEVRVQLEIAIRGLDLLQQRATQTLGR